MYIDVHLCKWQINLQSESEMHHDKKLGRKIIFRHGMKAAVSNLQVGLLAALNQLVESRRSKVSVDVGRIQPLQSLHDYLLQDKRTEDTFRGSHTELVHVVDSCQ